MTRTAEFVKDVSEHFNGTAKLWKLSKPIEWLSWDSDGAGDYAETTHSSEYVVTSAADVMFSGPETYIFPADENGHVINWSELHGSFRGDLDHQRAIEGLLALGEAS